MCIFPDQIHFHYWLVHQQSIPHRSQPVRCWPAAGYLFPPTSSSFPDWSLNYYWWVRRHSCLCESNYNFFSIDCSRLDILSVPDVDRVLGFRGQEIAWTPDGASCRRRLLPQRQGAPARVRMTVGGRRWQISRRLREAVVFSRQVSNKTTAGESEKIQTNEENLNHPNKETNKHIQSDTESICSPICTNQKGEKWVFVNGT